MGRTLSGVECQFLLCYAVLERVCPPSLELSQVGIVDLLRKISTFCIDETHLLPFAEARLIEDHMPLSWPQFVPRFLPGNKMFVSKP